jgi:hypothetical protein
MAETTLPTTRAALRALARQQRLDAATPEGEPPRMLPGYHLPSVIRWGQTPASRLSKKGTWYIIIPFQHTSPGYGRPGQQMSSATYRQAKQLAPGERLRPSGITRARYGRRTYLSFVTITPATKGFYIPSRPVPPGWASRASETTPTPPSGPALAPLGSEEARAILRERIRTAGAATPPPPTPRPLVPLRSDEARAILRALKADLLARFPRR